MPDEAKEPIGELESRSPPRRRWIVAESCQSGVLREPIEVRFGWS